MHSVQPSAAHDLDATLALVTDDCVFEFGIDAGEGLSEHQASRAAVVQVLSGRLRFTVDGEDLDLGPGLWLHMSPGTPHALEALEPTVMLLTLVQP
jgi:quercetin dioxygenase-like cupin family protein